METKTDTLESIKAERDMIVAICKETQKREAHHERAIKLLLIAGHLNEDRYKQALDLAEQP